LFEVFSLTVEPMSRKAIYSDPAQNRGVQLLRALPHRLLDLAIRLDTTKASAHEWRQGSKTPNRAMREKIARAYGIPPDAWEQPPRDDVPAVVDEAPDPLEAALPLAPPANADPATLTNLEAVHRLLREIREAAVSPDITPTTREKLAARELMALRFRHECEMRDLLTQDRIVAQHKEWRAVRERLAYIVGGCDRCARMVTDALVELGV
jgi:transcriptional regulator with XRE-family HTH domain